MIADKNTLRLMLSYLDIDENGIDATYRILKNMDHDEAISVIWTLLGWLFPAVDGSRAAWESWLQNGLAGHPITPVPDDVRDIQ
jgi:hypothetical protein